jgi:hypothetical protein
MSEFDLNKFKTKPRPVGHMVRDGKRIEIEELVSDTPAPEKRKKFEPPWTQFPAEWAKRLRGQSGSVHDLAHYILQREFECRQKRFGEIILSTAATKMSRTTRGKAVMALVMLGLIEAEQCGNQTFRVTHLLFLPPPSASRKRNANQPPAS